MAYCSRNENSDVSRRRLTTLDGRPVADVRTDWKGRRYSFKTISGSKHILRTPPAIAFDKSVLEQAERLGVEYHVVKDRESGRVRCAEHSKFMKHGFPVARWSTPQFALPLGFWHEGAEPPQTSLFDDGWEGRNAA